MKRLVLVLASVLVVLLATVVPAMAEITAAENADCVSCHGAPEGYPAEGFHLGPVDKAQCNRCHWGQGHWFDWYHDGYLEPFMTMQCADCHDEDLGFPVRPEPFMGTPSTPTDYGWFQSAGSLDATPGQLHAIHANGSWQKDVADCTPCHGQAACDACHVQPAEMHDQHLNLGVQAIPTTVLIGRTQGHDCPDTYLYATNPSTNYGSASAFYVGKTSSGEERAILRFPLASIPETFTSAMLQLTRSTGSPFAIRAYRLRRTDWVSGQATWNNYKAGSAWAIAGAGDATSDYYADEYAESASSTIDVTGLLRAAAANGDTSLELLLRDPAPVARRYTGFYSAESVYAPYSPLLKIDGSNLDTAYASPPISYTVALGTPVGDPLAGTVRTAASTCVSSGCHELANAANAGFKPECADCHEWGDVVETHGPVHEPSGLDTGCLACHLDNLLDEHLSNPATHDSELRCQVCHNSSNPNFAWAIDLNDKTCSQCHTTAHALGLAPTPVGVPLYPDSRWSPVVDSTLYVGEPWLPSSYAASGEMIFSDRRADVPVWDAWIFYRDQLGAAGWSLMSPAPSSSDTSFSANWSKGRHGITVLYFRGVVPGDADDVPSGYRFNVLYK